MRNRCLLPLILLSLLITAGCHPRGTAAPSSDSSKQNASPEQHFINGSGEAGNFILWQTIAHGGHPAATNSLPAIGKNWRYFEDRYGVSIRLPRDRFPALESFFQKAFGKPSLPVHEMDGGGKMGGYGVKAVGAGIQFGIESNECFVVILRPLKTKEILQHLPEALEKAGKIN